MNGAGTQSREEAEGVVLVTGAASGIGRELTRQFVRNGHDVLPVDRDEAGLGALEPDPDGPGSIIEPLALDLTDRDAPDRVESHVEGVDRQVEVLVNNAGVPVYGRFDETGWEDERAMIRLNVEATTALSDRFVEGMVARESGRILNTASLAGVVPTPTAAVYGGTKAYVLSFSLALAEEFADDGITVTALCPGETDTEFMERGGMGKSAVANGDLLDPATVAKAGYEGLMAGERIVVPGRRDRFRYLLSRFLPHRLAARLSRRLWSG